MNRLVLLTFVALFASAVRAQVPASRVEKLSRGVNVPHWFWYPRDALSPQNYLTKEDAERIRAAGLLHVRVPIEPGPMWDEMVHKVRPDRLAEFRRSLDMLVRAGLLVIVDVHPNQSPWAAIEGKSPDITELKRFWAALASALADTDPEWVMLELLNEPHNLPDHEVWPRAQAQLLAEVRRAAPKHTIILTGDDWGGIDGLLRLKGSEDTNIVYSFHFYEPHNFTHQGAEWGFAPWRHMKDIPYPWTKDSMKLAADKIEDKQAKDAVQWAGKETWNAAKVRSRIELAATWAREHHATLYCGEFGVYRKVAPKTDRAAWIRDVTAALKEFGIGWGMWDYAGGFALFEGEPGKRHIDAQTAAAAGLSP